MPSNVGSYSACSQIAFWAMKMNEFALRARECQSEVCAFLILCVCGLGNVQYWTSGEFWIKVRVTCSFFAAVWLWPHAYCKSVVSIWKHEFIANVAMGRNILHMSDAFYPFDHFPYWKLSVGKWLWPLYMRLSSKWAFWEELGGGGGRWRQCLFVTITIHNEYIII